MSAAEVAIDVIDWREGALTLTRPDGTSENTIVLALSGPLHMQALGAIAAARRASVLACEGHQAMRTEQRRFTGPVASRLDINPLAHGGTTDIETCGCGAKREINVRDKHRETGPWS